MAKKLLLVPSNMNVSADMATQKDEELLALKSDLKIDCGSYLILMRHAESEYNALKKWTGWHDPTITDKGKKISFGAGKIISMMKLPMLTRLYTSSLKRTIQTSHFVCDGLNILCCQSISTYLFNERALGNLQNTTYEIMDDASLSNDAMAADSNHHLYPAFCNSLSPATVPNGLSENMIDFEKRVNYGFDEYIAPDILSGHNILIVSHSGTIRCICDRLSIEANTNMGNCDVFLIWFQKGLEVKAAYYGALSQLEKH